MFSTKGCSIITREEILFKISEFDIFKYYIPSLELSGKLFCSELRFDKKPSCKVTVFSNNETIYKDFSNGESYNCFEYIKKKFNLTEQESLKVISNDFNLGLISLNNIPITMGYIGIKSPIPIIRDKKSDLKIVSIPFTNDGFHYWNTYYIRLSTLKFFDIKQISHYYVNNNYINIKKGLLAFAYDFDNYIYKILRPFDKDWKWLSNADSSVVQGLKQLPESGDLLIITKSLKDVAVLYEIGYSAIAPQSENTGIPIEIFNQLKEKWKTIVLYFDNDAPGIEAAKKYSVIYGIKYIHNGVKSQKDASDFSKKRGLIALGKKMKRMLNSIK